MFPTAWLGCHVLSPGVTIRHERGALRRLPCHDGSTLCHEIEMCDVALLAACVGYITSRTGFLRDASSLKAIVESLGHELVRLGCGSGR